MLVGLPTQTSTQPSGDGSTHYRIKVAKTSACLYVCAKDMYMSPLTKSKGTRDKNIYNVRGGKNG